MWWCSDYLCSFVCVGAVITGFFVCGVAVFVVWYCEWFGRGNWFGFACFWEMSTGLLLFVLGQCILVCYCVWWDSDILFDIVFVGAVITGLVLCVVGQ